LNEFGIDIAHEWTINDNLAQQLDFVIPRCGTLGYGKMGTSDYYNKQLSVDGGVLNTIQTAIRNGKPWSVYIFSYAFDSRSAEVEADRVCDYLDGLGLVPDLPIFFDWERTGQPEGSYEQYTQRVGTFDRNVYVQMVSAFCAKVEARGYRAGWYNALSDNTDWLGNSTTQLWRDKNWFFWCAIWRTTPPPISCDIWQYAGDVKWNGINADLNSIMDDRIFDFEPPPPHGDKLPVWLMLYIMQKNKKERSITTIT